MKTREGRRHQTLPGGIPRYIRVYDNGGGSGSRFCRKCLHFTDAEVCDSKVPNPDHPERTTCGHKTIPQREGAGSFDRYTVVFTGNFKGRNKRTFYVGMSTHPFHPQGFGQHGDTEETFDAPGGSRPAGIGDKAKWGGGDSRRITFQRLPPDCQKLVVSDYMATWGISKEIQTEFNLCPTPTA